MNLYVMNKIKQIIRECLNENKTYDELILLKRWYEEEKKKIDDIGDYKTWKLKNKLLQKQYFNKKNEIIKKENPFGLEGDMDANYIYHYTNGNSLIGVIENNVLISGGYGGISFTSHPNLYKRGFVFWHPNRYSKGKHHGNIGIKIKFDFNQMKRDGLKFIKGSENIGTHSGEDEIRLKQNKIENPIKYIKEIIIFKDKEVDYMKILELLDNNNIDYKLI